MNTSKPSAPESPAKEQPGEQNVAELIRLLNARADGDLQHPAELLCRNAAALLAKLGQGWIPVSERLPEHGVDVMIYHVLGDRDRAEVPHAYDVGWLLKDGWYFPWDRGRDRQRPMFVTHWMPLPPPPPERP